jgi:hypothetical protein
MTFNKICGVYLVLIMEMAFKKTRLRYLINVDLVH